MSIKTKQVVGVTLLVGSVALGLSVVYVASFARLSLDQSGAHGEAIALLIFQRAQEALKAGGDPVAALQGDEALRSLLRSSLAYAPNVEYAAITDVNDAIIVHGFDEIPGARLPRQELVSAVLDRGARDVLQTVTGARSLEVVRELPLGDQPFGAVRIGISTVLLRENLREEWYQITQIAGISVLIAVALASALSQWLLRPIHVLRSSLTRLGRGELGVTLDLPKGEEFSDLAQSFQTINERLAAAQSVDPGDVRSLLRYSHKLVALGRLQQGLAHEIKNPLNAMTIHLEILKQKLSGSIGRRPPAGGGAPAQPPAPDSTALMKHANTIGDEIRRLESGGAELPQVRAAAGADPWPRLAAGPHHRRPAAGGARSHAPRRRHRRDGARRSARDPGRCRHAEPVAAESRAERLSGHARRRNAPRPRGTGRRPHRVLRRGFRRRHSRGTSRARLRPVLHDAHRRQRHGPAARLPHGSSCTTARSC